MYSKPTGLKLERGICDLTDNELRIKWKKENIEPHFPTVTL